MIYAKLIVPNLLTSLSIQPLYLFLVAADLPEDEPVEDGGVAPVLVLHKLFKHTER